MNPLFKLLLIEDDESLFQEIKDILSGHMMYMVLQILVMSYKNLQQLNLI